MAVPLAPAESPELLAVNIYALRCPDTGAVRYVGKTETPLPKRLRAHMTSYRGGKIGEWIASLREQRREPRIELLEATDLPSWPDREAYWVRGMLERGEPLLNSHLTHGRQRVVSQSGRRRPRKLTTIPERFWSRVDQSGECWEWQGQIEKRSGYGVFYHAAEGRDRRAHCFSYELAHGVIPDGQVIRHACDNRRCVRPDHLVPGTQAENVGDMIARGRLATGDRCGARKYPERYRWKPTHALRMYPERIPRGDTHCMRLRPECILRGEQRWNATLTEAQVRDIRARYERGGVRQKDLAEEFGVTRNAIYGIVSGRTWKHL